jgi:1-pyrroline-5-carboxylate dehydrogenase
MEFRNENTFGMGEEKLNSSFAEALRRVRRDFGRHYPMHIGGEEIFSDEEVPVASPIDRRLILGYFQKGRVSHVNEAAVAARQAFLEVWRDTDWRKRLGLMEDAASAFSQRKFEIAAILSYENGKSRDESVGEVDEAIDFLRYYVYLIRQGSGLILERTPYEATSWTGSLGHQGARSSGERVRIISKPFGVWSVIAPFNFPVSISTGMCAAALVTGNTVVFKPSFGDNPTPMTGIKMYEIFQEAGLPKGVLNYITGSGGEIGDEMVKNGLIEGIVFTGSRKVAQAIQVKLSGCNAQKQFVAEMGSKNPVIVSGTANMDQALRGVISAAFGFCGQKCSAASRAIIHTSIYGAFIKELVDKLGSLRIGNPLESGVYMGPLIGHSALDKYVSSVEQARNDGRVLYGGHRLEGDEIYENGFYVEPTLIEVPPESELFKSELFLPILAVTSYEDFKKAVALANGTEYGLTAGLYTGDKAEIDYFNDNIEFGTTYVNRDASATTGAVVGQQTFVGWKGSSITCKGTSSLSYLLQFTREHSQTVVE